MDHFWPFWWQKSQKLTFVQKWIIFAYFVKKGPKFVSHDSLSGNNEKINYLQKVQKWTIFWPFWWQKSQKWSKNGPFLDFLEIVYFFVISTQGIMGNKLRTLFHKISKNYPLLHWSQFLPFLQSKWWKNGLFFALFGDSLFFRYFYSGNHNEKINYLQKVQK